MKLWQGRFEEESDPVFEKMNRSLGVDAVLLEVDIRASRAHARGLLGCGVLTQQEWKAIDQGLEQILSEYTPAQAQANLEEYDPDKAFLYDITFRAVTPLYDPGPGESIHHQYAVYNGPMKVRLLRQLEGSRAVEIACTRLRSVGMRPPLQAGVTDAPSARLWAAALAFPIDRASALRAAAILDPSMKGLLHA